MAAKNKSNEIRISRIYDAPLKTVWEAWTDPKQVAQWWGPRGFTLTHHHKDLRVGGTWKYTMHGPDGTDWPNITRYLEVQPPAVNPERSRGVEPLAKLVYDHGGSENQPPLFRVTVLFSEVAGKTKMDMTMGLATVEAAEETRRFIKKAGGDSTWDRLAEYLEKDATGTEKFVIARAFDVSLEKMFELWTKPEHVAHWLPPVGSQMQFKHADIRTGGTSSYVMTGVHGTMYGRAEYLQIERPNRLVYLQQFCDEQGNLSRHPMAPTWPETMLTTVTLTAEGPDRTRVRVEWEPHGAVRPEELQTFVTARAGMAQGWTGSFDKLEELIEAT